MARSGVRTAPDDNRVVPVCIVCGAGLRQRRR